MIRVNPFAKFGAISDATLLWRSAAEQLSRYAAEVMPSSVLTEHVFINN